MEIRPAPELRMSAARLREMASEGSDHESHAALLLVAEEFEQEAARVEALENLRECNAVGS
jgi:hypothetical protein